MTRKSRRWLEQKNGTRNGGVVKSQFHGKNASCEKEKIRDIPVVFSVHLVGGRENPFFHLYGRTYIRAQFGQTMNLHITALITALLNVHPDRGELSI